MFGGMGIYGAFERFSTDRSWMAPKGCQHLQFYYFDIRPATGVSITLPVSFLLSELDPSQSSKLAPSIG
jgi:hypothetical protein